MSEIINQLLQNAKLNIIEFDIHRRKEMETFNRELPFYVMSYHKAGEAKLRVGKETYNVKPGTAIIIPPHVEHDHFKESEEESTFLWCHFTYNIGNVVDVMKLFNFPIVFELRNCEEFEKSFKQFVNISNKGDFLSKTILAKAKSYEMFYLLLDSLISFEDFENEPIKQNQSASFLNMFTQIITHPEKNISLNELSKQFHLHPTYISNRFKAIFGESPIQIQKELKIEHSKKLLKSTDMTITEISKSIGFSGVTGFSRLFKTYVGVSPTQYRTLK